METTRAMRASGVAGLLAAVLILVGLYLATAWDRPAIDAAGEAMAAWAQRAGVPIELGVYYLLVPGLLLFLWMFSALAGLLPVDAMSTRLATYGALGFFIFVAAAGVLTSISTKSFGFYAAFEDPTAITVFTGLSAGYNLQLVGVWSLAVTMLAAAVGLRSAAAISTALFFGSIVLAVLAVVASEVGFGVIPCLVWIVAVGIGLLRWTPAGRGAVSPTDPLSG